MISTGTVFAQEAPVSVQEAPVSVQEDPVSVQKAPVSVQTDDNHYDEGDTIVISGEVKTPINGVNIILQLFTEGNMIGIAKITVAKDGSYSHTVLAEGPLWKKSGTYLVRASYEVGGGTSVESKFTYSPESEIISTTTNFEVDAGSYGTFDVKYTIKGGTLKNMVVDSNIFTLIVQIDATDEGKITLDLPRNFIGSEKQDGKDDTFIVLIDGIEVAYEEAVVLSDTRVITIDFEQRDSDIKIIGTYNIGHKRTEKTIEPKIQCIREPCEQAKNNHESKNQITNLKNQIIFLEDEIGKSNRDNFKLQVENKKLINKNSILEKKLDDLQSIINEQIKVIMEVLQDLKSK